MKRITLEDEHGIYTIETTYGPETIDQIFETLIIPALLAAGFHQDTIKDYLDDDPPTPWQSRKAQPGDEGYTQDEGEVGI